MRRARAREFAMGGSVPLLAGVMAAIVLKMTAVFEARGHLEFEFIARLVRVGCVGRMPLHFIK